MPANNGYINRKARKEGALERLLKNLDEYEKAEDKAVVPNPKKPSRTIATKLKAAEIEEENLKHNISTCRTSPRRRYY